MQQIAQIGGRDMSGRNRQKHVISLPDGFHSFSWDDLDETLTSQPQRLRSGVHREAWPDPAVTMLAGVTGRYLPAAKPTEPGWRNYGQRRQHWRRPGLEQARSAPSGKVTGSSCTVRQPGRHQEEPG